MFLAPQENTTEASDKIMRPICNQHSRLRSGRLYGETAMMQFYKTTMVRFVYYGTNPQETWPDFSLLKRAFDDVGIKYQVMSIDYATDIYQDGATTADPVIYIGEQ
jgi:hypothetical protein